MYIFDICDLFCDSSDIHVYVVDAETTFCFDSDNLPDELSDVEIDSIDNPYFNSGELVPMCFNVSEENFEDFEQFKAEYVDSIVRR